MKKYSKISQKIIHLLCFSIAFSVLWSCARYADDIAPMPQVTVRLPSSPVFAPVTQTTAKEQSTVTIAVTLNAPANIKELRVFNQNNQEVAFFDTFTGTAATFNWDYTVPENTPQGTQIQLRHVLTDLNGNVGEAIFTIVVEDIFAPTIAVNIKDGTEAFATAAREVAVVIVANFDAPEGLRELRVNASGAGITPTEEVIPASAISGSSYEYGYVVPTDANLDEVIMLEFTAVDVLNKTSAPAQFVITVEDIVVQVSGNLSGMNNWTKNKIYQINGLVTLENGATLNIEEGTLIQGTKGTNDELFIEGQINVQGTATEPVVMGSGEATPAPGDWVGLSFSATASGTIRYLIVEFAGEGDAQDGAFTFRNTTDALDIQFVQAYRSAKEGFRFRGGTVNLKYAISTDCANEAFRLDDDDAPYNGKGQFWIVDGGNPGESIGIRDGSQFLVSNVSIIGIGTGAGNNALRVRGGAVRMFNSIAAFNGTGIRFASAAVPPFALTDNPVLAHGRYFENGSNYHSTTSAFDGQLNNSTDVVAGIAVGDFVPDAAPTGVATSTIDTWFTDVNFIGAVQNAANNWTSGWAR